MSRDKVLCGDCVYFDPSPKQTRTDQSIGYCHANPPTSHRIVEDERVRIEIGVFPVVISDMWCGIGESV